MADSILTKRALGAAAKELMSVKPFTEVTVGDICELCGLNRKSLYYHFADKYDLVNWVFHDELIVPLELKHYQNFWQLLEEITNYMYENRMFYYYAFGMRGANRFWDYFSKYLQPHIYEILHNQLAGGGCFTLREKEEAYAEFLADAFVCSIEKWSMHNPQLPPERYVELFKLQTFQIQAFQLH